MSLRLQKLQLGIVLFFAVGIAAGCSHSMVRLLGIRTGGMGYKLLASGNEKPLALAAGSSLMVGGLSWKQISQECGVGIENWFVAGSSPSEWEAFQERSPEARLTFIVVSVYDLNEDFLCDYRAAVAPLSLSIRDLRESRADWQFSKRLLSQYPRELVRVLFPTVGRSDGVMTGLRDAVRKMAGRWIAMDSEAGPTISSGADSADEEIKTEKLTDWSKDRLLRRMTLMRAACGDRHTFNGPKKLALLRMLRVAAKQGRVIVIVLPVSPLYKREFLAPEVVERFEAALTDAQSGTPEALWLRLDEIPDLHSNDYFWDLVHMNSEGQRIATKAFLTSFRKSSAAK